MEVIFSCEENQIRHNWFRASLVYVLGSLGVSLGCYFFMAYYGGLEIANESLVEFLGYDLSLAIRIAIIFYFAYRKFGTKWIGMFLLLSPIRTFFLTIKELRDAANTIDLDFIDISYMAIFDTLSILLFLYFWIHCRRLYKLNKIIKKRKLEMKIVSQS